VFILLKAITGKSEYRYIIVLFFVEISECAEGLELSFGIDLPDSQRGLCSSSKRPIY
jgi:hypothetical protein